MVRTLVSVAVATLLCTSCYREPAGKVNPQAKSTSNPAFKAERLESPAPTKNTTPPATPTDSETPDAAGDGNNVKLGKFALTAPDAWVRKQVRSPILMTEFALPKAEGDPRDGRLTVSTAGGGIEANVERWKGQFVPQPEEASEENIEVGETEITLVDFSGTYNDRRGPFAPGTQRENYRMLAAIIPIEGQLFFIKSYGPAKTMETHEPRFQKFIRSLRPAGASGKQAAKSETDKATPKD